MVWEGLAYATIVLEFLTLMWVVDKEGIRHCKKHIMGVCYGR